MTQVQSCAGFSINNFDFDKDDIYFINNLKIEIPALISKINDLKEYDNLEVYDNTLKNVQSYNWDTNQEVICSINSNPKRKFNNDKRLNEVKKKPKLQKGGATKAAHLALHCMILFSFALMMYLIFKGLALDQVNCFAWYSPFARLVRTGAQNTYCDILVSTNQIFGDMFKKIMTTPSISTNIKSIIGASTAAVVSYKSCVAFMKKFNTQISKIVICILGDRTDKITEINTIAEKFATKIDNCTKKNANSDEESEECESDEEGTTEGNEGKEGGKLKKKKTIKKSKTPSKKPKVVRKRVSKK